MEVLSKYSGDPVKEQQRLTRDFKLGLAPWALGLGFWVSPQFLLGLSLTCSRPSLQKSEDF